MLNLFLLSHQYITVSLSGIYSTVGQESSPYVLEQSARVGYVSKNYRTPTSSVQYPVSARPRLSGSHQYSSMPEQCFSQPSLKGGYASYSAGVPPMTAHSQSRLPPRHRLPPSRQASSDRQYSTDPGCHYPSPRSYTPAQHYASSQFIAPAQHYASSQVFEPAQHYSLPQLVTPAHHYASPQLFTPAQYYPPPQFFAPAQHYASPQSFAHFPVESIPTGLVAPSSSEPLSIAWSPGSSSYSTMFGSTALDEPPTPPEILVPTGISMSDQQQSISWSSSQTRRGNVQLVPRVEQPPPPSSTTAMDMHHKS